MKIFDPSTSVYREHETLAADFVKKGEVFRLVRREGFAAIYWKGRKYGKTGTLEVIEIQVSPAKTVKYSDGRIVDYPEQERYPSSKKWGLLGWTYPETRMDMAQERFAKVQNQLKGSALK